MQPQQLFGLLQPLLREYEEEKRMFLQKKSSLAASSSLMCFGILAASISFIPAQAQDSGNQMDSRGSAKAEVFLQSKGELTDLINESKETYAKLDKTYSFQSVEKSASCVVVFPGLTKAAIGVGATGGDGVATCKVSAGNQTGWSPLAFVDLIGGSAGLQLGVKVADVVMFMHDDNAAKQLREGKLVLGGDVSYTLGGQSAEKRLQRDAKSITVYSDQSGAFAGLSLDGAYIEEDEDEIEEFYEEEVKMTVLLSRPAGSEERSEMNDFITKLPR